MIIRPNPDGSFPVSKEEMEELRQQIGEIKNYPIRTYDQLLEKAKEVMAKDKRNIIMPYNPAVNIPMPPGMEVENYHDMNLVPGHRVSWEYKQQYTGKLAELFAEGYLTEEEYDKRVEWVNAALTSEQIDVVFSDLQKPLLAMKVDGYLPAEKKKTARPDWSAYVIFLTVVYAIAVTIVALSANLIGIGILTTEYLILALGSRKVFKHK